MAKNAVTIKIIRWAKIVGFILAIAGWTLLMVFTLGMLHDRVKIPEPKYDAPPKRKEQERKSQDAKEWLDKHPKKPLLIITAVACLMFGSLAYAQEVVVQNGKRYVSVDDYNRCAQDFNEARDVLVETQISLAESIEAQKKLEADKAASSRRSFFYGAGAGSGSTLLLVLVLIIAL